MYNFRICLLLAAIGTLHAGDLPDLRRQSNRVLVVSHRANYGDAPENSLSGISACIQGGVDMIEIDVAQTKDGVLVLMHDKTVNRSTDGKGAIKDMTWNEVKKLRLRKRDAGKTLTDESVPTLEDALELCKGKIYVNLDLKGVSIFDCVKAIKKTGSEDILMFRASNLDWLKKVHAALPKMYISPRLDFRRKDMNWPVKGSLLDFCKSWRDAIDIWGLDIPFKSIKHPAVSRENLAGLKKAKLHAWVLTLNTVSYGGFVDRDALKDPGKIWGKLIDHGFSVIMTDEPQALITYLKSIKRH